MVIKGFEKYSIDKTGSITVTHKVGKKQVTKRRTKNGFSVVLSDSLSGSREALVHILMSEVYNIDGEGDIIEHKDGDVFNNHLSNLCRVKTHSEIYGKKSHRSGDEVFKYINNTTIVSSFGAVLKVDIVQNTINTVHLKQNAQGYIPITTKIKGVKQNTSVHRLVADLFVPKVDGKNHIDHIDEVKTNNHHTNLRWCTREENTEYYINNTSRAYQKKLHDSRVQKVKRLIEKARIEKLETIKILKNIKNEREILEKEKESFEKYKTKELAIIKRNTIATPKVHGGKPIKVDNKVFDSCGKAAQYIVDKEAAIGISRNKDTISKELRKYVKGLRNEWAMYGTYTVGY